MSADFARLDFDRLDFDRAVAAPAATLWEGWSAPAARAIWAAPVPSVEVVFLEADPRVGGREVSLCRVAGQPDIRCDLCWLVLEPPRLSVHSEVVSVGGVTQSAALVTAAISAAGAGSRIAVTVQLAGLAADMAEGYRQGFGAGLDHLAGVAARCMVLRRVIRAPRGVVWGAWMNARTLPLWWGPEGYSCRTSRIDLRPGGSWVFDMIGPDGTVHPNHHIYHEIRPEERIAYALHLGEGGPKHADAWARFTETEAGTEVVLGMVFDTQAAFDGARAFGAEALGQQTLGKLARFVGAA